MSGFFSVFNLVRQTEQLTASTVSSLEEKWSHRMPATTAVALEPFWGCRDAFGHRLFALRMPARPFMFRDEQA